MNDNGARQSPAVASLISPSPDDSNDRTRKPSAAQLLETPGALLSRRHLRELGLERRAVDAVFRNLPTIMLPGYSRPLIRVADYRELLEQSVFRNDRVLAR